VHNRPTSRSASGLQSPESAPTKKKKITGIALKLKISRRDGRPRLGQTEDLCSTGNKPYEGAQLWLKGFGPRIVMFKVNVRLIAVKFSRSVREECGPGPAFAGFTLAFTVQLREKARKNLSQGCRKVPVGHESRPPFAGRQDKLSIPISLLYGTRINARSP
jgi:hypothetical protein